MIVLIILVVIFIVLFIPVNLRFKISRRNKDDNVYIYFNIFNRFNIFNIEVPFIDIININDEMNIEIVEQKKKNNRNKIKNEKKLFFSFDRVLNIFKKLYKHKHIVTTFRNYFIKKTKINNLYWETKVGYDNAAMIAVITGIMWYIKSFIFYYIDSTCNLIKYDYNVKTIYNNRVFETDFDCIISFKIVYIIIGAIYAIIAMMKGGEINV